MQEPSSRTSRLAIAGALAAAMLLAGGGFLLGRNTSERTATAPVPVPSPTPLAASSPVPPPVVRTIIGRAELLDLARLAADPQSEALDERLTDAVGKRFELRLPFGCDGPADQTSTAPMRWRYDAERRTLRVQATPTDWAAADWWRQSAPEGVASIEGFWIPRPWTASEACPQAPQAEGGPATPAEQTLAIGQVFLTDGPRQARRDGQPYQITKRIADDRLDTSRGFHLRLSGRIAGMPGGAGPVRCHQPGGPDRRPVCLLGVVFDQVAIESAASGEVIATWDVASGDTPSTERRSAR